MGRAIRRHDCNNVLTHTGWHMAKNLRDKIPESDILTVYDVNTASTQKLLAETNAKNLHIAQSPQEVAEKSVSREIPNIASSDELFVLSMI